MELCGEYSFYMGKKQKYYVVWKGVSPGVYTSWIDCQLQIKGYDGALYKSFDTQEEAEHAFASPAHHYIGNHQSSIKNQQPKALPENFDMNCVAVDAACSEILNEGQVLNLTALKRNFFQKNFKKFW